MERGSSTAERGPLEPDVAGSNPAPAVMKRTVGPHKVEDIRRTGLCYWVVCQKCKAGWPEGGHYPEQCE